MKGKGYIILKKHTKEPDVHGTIYSQEAYDSVKQQIERMKGKPISDNFDRTLPPAGKIIDVTEDETGILVTIEVDKKFSSKGLGIAGTVDRDDLRCNKIELYELTITDHPLPGHEIKDEF